MTRNANGVFSIKVSICMYTSCSISSTILALCPLGLIIQKSAIWRLAKSEKPQIDAKDEINIIFQKRQLLKALLCCGIFFNVDFTQLRDYIHTYFIALFTSYFQPNVLHIVMPFWIRASAVCWGKIDVN